MDVDSQKRKAGLRFADRLSEIAVDAPDIHIEHSVHELAKSIRKRFTYSRELRMREILTHVRKGVEHGGTAVADLELATGYHRHLIQDLADELQQSGLIEFRLIPPAGSGPGRPHKRLFPVETPNFGKQKS
jgi:hypothetical protein